MFSVGISVGLHRGLLSQLRRNLLKTLIVPVGIILGSLAGGIVCGMLLHFPLNQSVSIAGGMGWYSLAGVTIGNLAGASLGSIAFLSNLMREIGAFFMIPFLSRHCNAYTCIAPAAATSEDTTLPMLIRYTNEETVVFAVLNGHHLLRGGAGDYLVLLLSIKFPGSRRKYHLRLPGVSLHGPSCAFPYSAANDMLLVAILVLKARSCSTKIMVGENFFIRSSICIRV